MASLSESRQSYLRWAVLLVCPGVILIGNVVSLVSPAGHWTADKNSIINVWLIKKGWFWTSLIGWWCIVRYRGFDTRLMRQDFQRYVSFTVWWYIYTQALWIGVAPIMDLIFVFTGGHCNFEIFDSDMRLNSNFHDTEHRRWAALRKLYDWFNNNDRVPKGSSNLMSETLYWLKCRREGFCDKTPGDHLSINKFIQESLSTKYDMRSSSMCSRFGGQWVGGHDPSGHVFLITLMSIFLLEECYTLRNRVSSRFQKSCATYRRPFFNYIKELFSFAAIRNVNSGSQNESNWLTLFLYLLIEFLKTLMKIVMLTVKFVLWENPIILILALLCTWLWSIFVTSIVFHSFLEQCTGLVSAYVVILFLNYVC
ncbi:HCL335Cp [Eremothecium sinecaudum]|uniref:Acyl-coenzyme A diphosphatase SCS3 n=1 Tax=Eremothecium sinecaudum TaxID=45286 RepID=A0A120K1Y0_9SACH|nr:HCL335Cp [Eremothecium sinecaudum]AMD19816.1 HCL335Cp [Eremothecium sinecaudum]